MDPFNTRLAYLSFPIQKAAEAIFSEIIVGGYRARKEEAEQRHFEQTGERIDIIVGAATTPVFQMKELFDTLPVWQQELVKTAGRLVYAQHAADGEMLSDDEAYLTVLAGCTTWDRWEQRGGGCHWHADLWPTMDFQCPACEEDDYLDDTDSLLNASFDCVLSTCPSCKHETTKHEFLQTDGGKAIVDSVKVRELILAPWADLGLLEPNESSA
jgi:hypothetical protein